jgi:hypothetical protein
MPLTVVLKLLITCRAVKMDPPLVPSTTPAQVIPSIESQQSCFRLTPSPSPALAPWPKAKSKLSSSLLSLKPTPTLATALASKSKTLWTRLSLEDQLVLMNHVCERIGDYKDGRIKFWKEISELFYEDTGILTFLIYLIFYILISS